MTERPYSLRHYNKRKGRWAWRIYARSNDLEYLIDYAKNAYVPRGVAHVAVFDRQRKVWPSPPSGADEGEKR